MTSMRVDKSSSCEWRVCGHVVSLANDRRYNNGKTKCQIGRVNHEDVYAIVDTSGIRCTK